MGDASKEKPPQGDERRNSLGLGPPPGNNPRVSLGKENDVRATKKIKNKPRKRRRRKGTDETDVSDGPGPGPVAGPGPGPVAGQGPGPVAGPGPGPVAGQGPGPVAVAGPGPGPGPGEDHGRVIMSSHKEHERSNLVADELSDDPGKRLGDDDDEDSDPVLAEKRHQAALKNLLAAGAEAAIKRASYNLEKGWVRGRIKYTSIFLLTAAVCLIAVCHIYFLSTRYGPPPTLEANYASSLSIPVFLISALLAISAFVIMYLKLVNLIIGISWMLILICMEYMITIIVSKSAYTCHRATFEDIKLYSKYHYNLHNSIPKYVAEFERMGNCCGWGDPEKKFNTWPKLLEINDLPDSCCIIEFYGCGKAVVASGVPSGYIMALSQHEYSSFMKTFGSEVDTDLWFNNDDHFAKLFHRFPPWKGIPDVLLRYADEQRDDEFYYYMGDDNSNPNEPVSYVYKSFGQAENYRIRETIKESTCDEDAVVTATKYHTIYILCYSSIILLLCFIEAVIFWYFFVDERAELLRTWRQPGEFMLLQMERICIDDQFNAILRERMRLEELQKIRKEQLEEQEARDKVLAELEEQENNEQERPLNPHEIKKRNVILGGAKRR